MPEDDSIVPSMRWGCGNPKTSPTEQQAVMNWLHGNIIDTPVNGPHPGKATCKAHEHGRSLPSHSQYSEYVRAWSDSLPIHQLLHTHLFTPPRTQLHSRQLARPTCPLGHPLLLSS